MNRIRDEFTCTIPVSVRPSARTVSWLYPLEDGSAVRVIVETDGTVRFQVEEPA